MDVFSNITCKTDEQKSDRFKFLNSLRQQIDAIEIDNRPLANWLCKLIPAQCPLERDLQLFGQVFLHIPPLCKLNPVYDRLIGLRFRALTFLAENPHLPGFTGIVKNSIS